jgi:hypothetical protein
MLRAVSPSPTTTDKHTSKVGEDFNQDITALSHLKDLLPLVPALPLLPMKQWPIECSVRCRIVWDHQMIYFTNPPKRKRFQLHKRPQAIVIEVEPAPKEEVLEKVKQDVDEDDFDFELGEESVLVLERNPAEVMQKADNMRFDAVNQKWVPLHDDNESDLDGFDDEFEDQHEETKIEAVVQSRKPKEDVSHWFVVSDELRQKWIEAEEEQKKWISGLVKEGEWSNIIGIPLKHQSPAIPMKSSNPNAAPQVLPSLDLDMSDFE